MLLAPIKSLAFDLRHQVFINTLCFTGFDNKMDTVIETAVQKVHIWLNMCSKQSKLDHNYYEKLPVTQVTW